MTSDGMSNPDPVAILVSTAPAPCPRCGHRITSAPNGRCSECGTRLLARLAIDEPSAALVPWLLVALSLSAAVGLQRWLAYATRFDQLWDGRLASVRWYHLLLEVTLLAAPIVLIVILRRASRVRQARFAVVLAATVAAALPFLINLGAWL